MIIVKTPYRISLFGGSTDYKSFYSKYGSLLVGLAIDKYCYLSLRYNPTIFDYKSFAQYSKIEKVYNNSDIKHNGIRGVLKYMNIEYGIELSHVADIPSQTGMGSSSSFIVGLLNACHKLEGKHKSPEILASEAIYVERELLKESGGIQDQIWAAHGGFNSISIDKSGDINVRPLPIGKSFKAEFIRRSCLIYTGNIRKSFKVAKAHDNVNIENSKIHILGIAEQALKAFDNEDIDEIARLLYESWQHKKSISPLISSPEVDAQYDNLLDCGMIGGKLLGSGRAGFIFGIWPDKVPEDILSKSILFQPDYGGSTIIN